MGGTSQASAKWRIVSPNSQGNDPNQNMGLIYVPKQERENSQAVVTNFAIATTKNEKNKKESHHNNQTRVTRLLGN